MLTKSSVEITKPALVAITTEKQEVKVLKMQQVQSIPSVVKLNVGGRFFTTSLQTLTKSKIRAQG